MKNIFRFHRRSLGDLAAINSHESYHHYLIAEGIRRYQRTHGQGRLGSILAVCANYREGEVLSEFGFEKIALSGIGDADAYGGKLKRIIADDPRVTYEKENCENLSFASRSFDVVFCKEGLHHLARPVQGLYEMLRVCRKAVIFVESYDCFATRLLELLGLTTRFERNSGVNLVAARDNYVFRWGQPQLRSLLDSYYIDSGYEVDITLGWMSGRLFHNRPRVVKVTSAAVGATIALLPGCRGNFATVMITPGKDLPADPVPFAVNPSVFQAE